MDRTLGAWLVVAGVAIAIVGLLVASGALGWFGRLPGDLRFEGRDGGVRVFVPLASSLVLSVALSLAFMLLRRFL
ncbi:MAG: DUF2905 domain-containing protein [Chloroflexi bacterium]|nr:DUF2905 domain-containing protein [Chloroflexota bacterium]